MVGKVSPLMQEKTSGRHRSKRDGPGNTTEIKT